MIISCLALFAALGGTVYASSTISGKTIKKSSLPGNRVKKNSLPGNRIKKNSLTGTQINESKLGQVPSAGSAVNATNAVNAVNATNVNSVKPYSVGANNHEFVTLAKTASFELAGWCDPEDTMAAPGLESLREGTVVIIYNRGAAPAFADSSDDANYRLDTGQGIGFNYQDNGDGGMAMSTDGHFLSAPAWGNIVSDTSFTNEPTGHSYPFPTACHFAGAALVG